MKNALGVSPCPADILLLSLTDGAFPFIVSFYVHNTFFPSVDPLDWSPLVSDGLFGAQLISPVL